MEKVHKKAVETGRASSAKPNAIVLAGLRLFTQYGYRKTSIDDIAREAQAARRTVYLHFKNKAAVFLAILDYVGDQVRQRCAEAERGSGNPVDRLAGLLDAYFGMAFELFSNSEHLPELQETFLKLAQTKIAEFNADYNARIVKFLRALQKAGEIGRPPQGLTIDQVARILIRSAEGAKHDAKIQGNRKALEVSLRQLAALTIAAMSR
jgi:AcrR family transcriptional regulator